MQEPGTFTTQFNQGGEYNEHWMDDVTYDLAEDGADDFRWWIIWLTVIILAIGMACYYFWPTIHDWLPEWAVTHIQVDNGGPWRIQGRVGTFVQPKSQPLEIYCSQPCEFHFNNLPAGIVIQYTTNEAAR